MSEGNNYKILCITRSGLWTLVVQVARLLHSFWGCRSWRHERRFFNKERCHRSPFLSSLSWKNPPSIQTLRNPRSHSHQVCSSVGDRHERVSLSLFFSLNLSQSLSYSVYLLPLCDSLSFPFSIFICLPLPLSVSPLLCRPPPSLWLSLFLSLSYLSFFYLSLSFFLSFFFLAVSLPISLGITISFFHSLYIHI